MISVIVPAYNVAPYLERCVMSIQNQTYTDLEIILVNDGSTDDTGSLCDMLSGKDSRIKVIHKNNGGLSDARNAGIDHAKGDFLSFIDGDDFIESDTYEVMLAEMNDINVSMVAGGFFVTDIQGNTNVSYCHEKKCLTKKEAFIDLFTDNNISQSSCNKLFRRSLFENIRYKKGIINEDMEILPRLLDVSDNIVLIDKAIYHYIKKPGSITSSNYSMKRYQAIKIEQDIYRMCKKKYPELKPYASYYELKSLYGMLCNLMACENHKEFKLQELNIRRLIIKVGIRCNRWSEIKRTYENNIKTYCIVALVGTNNVDKLVKFKHKIMGRK